ncbi:MAG: hypothetical protein U1E29_00440 [Coriobacteriia bacterium]|nr:hypothetical protein [Coriobacteriia bacterium]
MAQAAYCAQCGTNVYVGPDGQCPQGHGAESLSRHYEVPDPPAEAVAEAAEQAEPGQPVIATVEPPAAAAPAAQAPKSNAGRVLVIIGIVLLALVLCTIGSCVGGLALFRSVGSEITSGDFEGVFEEEFEAVSPDADPESEEALRAELADAAREDIDRMVAYFYPWFESDSFYIVDVETDGGPAVIHIIAAYRNNPAFRITFFAERSTEADPAGSEVDGQAYYDEQAGVWWLHPETRDRSLDTTFGRSPLMTEAMLDQIATDFLAAHPGKIIIGVSEMTNVDLGFEGIDESELADWYDDFGSFESTWELDMSVAPSVWREVDYQEF